MHGGQRRDRLALIARWYRGWTMVGLGIVMVMLTVGSVLYSYSIYITPVAQDLGLSRETLNGGIVFQHVGTALLTPFIGRVLDRAKVSTVVAIAGVALGGGLVGLAIGDALWPRALLLALPISFGFSGAGSLASYVLVARWFKAQRGRAMAIVALGQSAGSVVLAPIIGTLIAAFGWRQALIIQGVSVAVALLAIAWAMVDRPLAHEVEPVAKVPSTPSSQAPAEPLPVRAILTSATFWLPAVTISITLAVVQATIVCLVPLATGRQIPLVRASALLSFLGMSGLAGKFLLAAVADRVDRRTLMILAVAIVLGFTLSLTMDFGYAGLVVSCLLAGMALGGIFPIYSALLADLFGGHSLGSTEGLVSPVISLTSAAAIYAAGVMYDRTGDYRLTFLVFSVALAVALVLAVALRLAGRAPCAQLREGVVA